MNALWVTLATDWKYFSWDLLTTRKISKILSALSFNIKCYFCVKKKKNVTESKYASLVYLYSKDFGCNMELCNRQRLGQNAAQKAVFLWSDVSCIVHSCASLSHQTALLNILVAGIPISLVEHNGFIYTHTLAEASSLSLSLFLCSLTAKETLSGLHA